MQRVSTTQCLNLFLVFAPSSLFLSPTPLLLSTSSLLLPLVFKRVHRPPIIIEHPLIPTLSQYYQSESPQSCTHHSCEQEQFHSQQPRSLARNVGLIYTYITIVLLLNCFAYSYCVQLVIACWIHSMPWKHWGRILPSGEFCVPFFPSKDLTFLTGTNDWRAACIDKWSWNWKNKALKLMYLCCKIRIKHFHQCFRPRENISRSQVVQEQLMIQVFHVPFPLFCSIQPVEDIETVFSACRVRISFRFWSGRYIAHGSKSSTLLLRRRTTSRTM